MRPLFRPSAHLATGWNPPRRKRSRTMKKRYAPILIGLVTLVVFSGAALGVSMFIKTVAGLGNVTYTDAVAITDIKVKSLAKVTVSVTSNANTVADQTYHVDLYLDGTALGAPQDVSWVIAEIPGTTIKVAFDGLDLSAVTDIDAEVTE